MDHTTAFAPTQALDTLPTGTDAAPSISEQPLPGRYLAVGDGDGPLIALARPITRIGRGLSADVHLEDPGVSRRHALIVQRRGRVRILDDRSVNGTFVNGRRVLEADLQDGDVIVLGRVVLVYVDVAG
jgi:pSer/pThr/pTyr-binding forkhead associated (FHA) protein